VTECGGRTSEYLAVVVLARCRSLPPTSRTAPEMASIDSALLPWFSSEIVSVLAWPL
jgi:hypothetical protein